MHARDLADEYPILDLDADAVEAIRTLGAMRLPGIIVRDDNGQLYAVVPDSQVLRMLVPRFVQEDPLLARVYDEHEMERLVTRLGGRTVRDLLPRTPLEPAIVGPDETVLEVASRVIQSRSPIVAVVEDNRVVGAITIARLLTYLLPAPEQGT